MALTLILVRRRSFCWRRAVACGAEALSRDLVLSFRDLCVYVKAKSYIMADSLLKRLLLRAFEHTHTFSPFLCFLLAEARAYQDEYLVYR